jgi:hypothetical protein
MNRRSRIKPLIIYAFLLCSIGLKAAEPLPPTLPQEIATLKDLQKKNLRSYQGLCWIPLLFPTVKANLKSSSTTLTELIAQKETQLRNSLTLPSRLNGRSVVWNDWAQYHAYTEYTGSWSHPQREVHFQTRAQLSFHSRTNLNDESPPKFEIHVILKAVDPVPAETPTESDAFVFRMKEPQELITFQGPRLLFRSEPVDMISAGKWTRSNYGREVITLSLIVNPADLSQAEIQLHNRQTGEPYEVRVWKWSSSENPPMASAVSRLPSGA